MGRVYGNQFPRGVDNHIMIHSIDPSHSVNQAKDSVPPKKNRKGGGKSGGGGGDSKGSSQIVIIVDHENNNSSIQNCDNNTGVSNNNDCPRTSNTDDAPRTSNNDNIPSTTNESVDRYYSSDIPTTAFLTPHQSSVTHSSPSQDTSSYYTSNRHKSYPNDLPSYNDPSPNHHSY
ncbi:hypothetical protein BGZ76_011639 [Entomortierella beljakovae]|nr:hypothetical protein BGZ76_011639 [Entomortierella beljakovae]